MNSTSPRTDGVLLVQISDTHLTREAGSRLRGVVVAESLREVLRLLRHRHPQCERLWVTGDISHDGSVESYRRLRELTAPLGVSLRCLPGNHDRPEVMREQLAPSSWPEAETIGAWRLIALSTHLPGSEGGYLDETQLAGLEAALQDSRDRPTLIALHHPPLETGSPWLDRIGLRNGDAFRRLVSAHAQVRAVLFGHAHQEIDHTLEGIRWLGCPATCVQFLPRSHKPCSDRRLPGYRWLRLCSDGTLETGIERLAAWPAGSHPEGLPDGAS